MYSFCAMYSLRMSFWRVPEILRPVGTLFFGDGEIHGPDDGGGRIDGHRGGDIGERNLVEEDFHVGERADGDAAFANFTFGQCVIGVVAHQGGEIEGSGKAGLALSEEITEALVGVLGGAEAGELAHGPHSAAMHGGVNAAGVGRLTGEAEVAGGVPVFEVGRGVEAANGVAGDGRELGLALGAFVESGLEGGLFPLVEAGLVIG